MVAPLKAAVDGALPDQNAGRQEDRFEREDHSKKRKRVFVDGVVREPGVECHPGGDKYELEHDELCRADKPADPV